MLLYVIGERWPQGCRFFCVLVAFWWHPFLGPMALASRLTGFFGFVRCRCVAEKTPKKTGIEAQPHKDRKGNQNRKRKRNPTTGDGPASRIKWPARRNGRNPDAEEGGYPDAAAPKRPVHAGRVFSAEGRHDHGGMGDAPFGEGPYRASLDEKRHHTGGDANRAG